jgi:hypothetical protein
MPESTYDGVDGLKRRDDLAGENLTQVPQPRSPTSSVTIDAWMQDPRRLSPVLMIAVESLPNGPLS